MQQVDKETIYARWISGELSSEELQSLREDGSLQELEAIMRATDDLALPAYDRVSGYAKFKTKYGKKETKTRRLNWRWASGIAATMLLLCIAKMSFFSSNEQMFIAQNGVNEQMELVDGSKILVNDGSSIRHDPSNWAQERTVHLTGEAFFEIEKGAPFSVKTDNGIIKVLGTKFNVRSWGKNIYVECYEGKVQVIVGDQEEVLVRNESVNVILGEMDQKKEIAHQNPQWKQGNSRFYQEDIREVFNELERQFDIKVESTLLKQIFSGNFQHDNLENAVRNVCKPLGLKYSFSSDKKTVLIEE